MNVVGQIFNQNKRKCNKPTPIIDCMVISFTMWYSIINNKTDISTLLLQIAQLEFQPFGHPQPIYKNILVKNKIHLEKLLHLKARHQLYERYAVINECIDDEQNTEKHSFVS